MAELLKRSVGIRASTERRFLAYMIDVAVMYLLAMAVPALAMVVTFLLRVDPAVQMGLAVGSMAATPVLYLWLCVGRWGQTVGKRILGMRVGHSGRHERRLREGSGARHCGTGSCTSVGADVVAPDVASISQEQSPCSPRLRRWYPSGAYLTRR